MYVWPQIGNLILQVYMVAAWWSPEQGDSFGARMLADNSGVVGFGVSALCARSASSPYDCRYFSPQRRPCYGQWLVLYER